MAPAACWWARTIVLSRIRYSKSASSDTAAKMRSHTPLVAQRLNRRKALFQRPKASGRSRQGAPVRTIHSTPSTNMRLSRPVKPGPPGRPETKPETRAHCSSVNTRRSIVAKAALRKAALNHSGAQNGILSVHRT